MSLTLLQIVNRVRALLREDAITAIADDDSLSLALVEIVNSSMRDVLDARRWSFLRREDLLLRFPAPYSGTTILATAASASPGTISVGTGTAAMITELTSERNLWRLAITSNGATNTMAYPNFSYRVTSCASALVGTNLELTTDISLIESASISVSNGAWEAYTNELALASTVGRILSVRNESQPLQLVFLDRDITIDQLYPRPLSSRSDNPRILFVGGTGQPTYVTGDTTPPSVGQRVAIFPVLTRSIVLRASYLYRHADLAAVTDKLDGVPGHVDELIVQRAFWACLTSNIQSDPDRAKDVWRQYETQMSRSMTVDGPDPLRRNIPVPFGSRLSGGTNTRWETQQVPDP